MGGDSFGLIAVVAESESAVTIVDNENAVG
jgi:hypothetical protein